MPKLDAPARDHLLAVFGDRVSFRGVERRLYGHDVASVPKLFKPLVGATVPDGIVQPETEAELVDLAHWARLEGVPLTPRGKATSGYGGAVPTRRGVVVDFYRLRRVLEVDRAAGTVTVEPGIVWEKLDDHLAKHDLTLRLYPTSYPSSTAGGWLAQGGAGIGSWESGWFRDNVLSVRLVLPDGRVRDLQGDDVDLVSGAEGITGLVSRLTLRVMPREEIRVAAIAVPDPGGVQRLAQEMDRRDLPVWSLLFINPEMAALRNRSPVRKGQEHFAGERVELPEEYVALLAFRASDRLPVRAALKALAEAADGWILDDDLARREWEERFDLMRVKRLGPSLVPSEVVVPLDELGPFLTEAEATIRQPLAMEGLGIRRGRGGRPEVVILGFIPADERTLAYNFVFGLALSVLRIAERHGGRAYSTGMFFRSKAADVLGEEQAGRLSGFKSEMDPDELMNPGKVIGAGVLSRTLKLAGTLEPLVRWLGNRIHTQVGERPPARAVEGIPPDVAWFAYCCSQCGFCVDECDQFYGRGWESQSPRGKWFWLRGLMEGREEWDQFMVDTFLSCTTCELCVTRCCTALPIEPSWMKLRGKLVHDDGRMTFPPFEMMAAALESDGDIWTGYRRNRDDWFPEDLRERHGPGVESAHVYFAGCTASYVEQDVAIGSVRLLDAAGIDFTYLGEDESCCATPMLVAGKWDLFVDTMKRNIAAVKAAGADTVVTSCPACDMMWRKVYPDWAAKEGIEFGIETKHYSELVAEKLASGDFAFPTSSIAGDGGQAPVTRVAWHDSCHIGRASGVYEPPRDVIGAIPGVDLVELLHNREEAHCCGSLLTLVHEPAVAAAVGEMKLEEAEEVGTETLLSLCPCCEFQLRTAADARGSSVEVVDLAHFAATRLGFDLPDPNPSCEVQWAVFERLITLMTPEGFAGMLESMWPEIVDAMPSGTGRALRIVGPVAGALGVAKPLFSLLFPRLLPSLMPKVMPTLIDRVSSGVPMPDYMAEQMPDLMPKVVENLMPHMMVDLVPLVTDSLLRFLRTEKASATV